MKGIPEHLGLIMDGNGRWAQERDLPRSAGHKAGYEHISEVLQMCADHGINIVSAFAWSTENWQRPKQEVDFIMKALEDHLGRFIEELNERGIRFLHSGTTENLSKKGKQILASAVNLTKDNSKGIFNLAFNYGGRSEIARAVRKIVEAGANPEEINEEIIGGMLWTGGLPDVDLVVRTGGDNRVSNFLLWKSAYTCIYIADCYWPAFGKQELEDALHYYAETMEGAA